WDEKQPPSRSGATPPRQEVHTKQRRAPAPATPESCVAPRVTELPFECSNSVINRGQVTKKVRRLLDEWSAVRSCLTQRRLLARTRRSRWAEPVRSARVVQTHSLQGGT